MFTVIAYDIVDDRTRYRVVKTLRRYAVRVQKSVFEAPKLPPNHFRRLRGDLEEIIDPAVDRIRYYFLCGSCIKDIKASGTAGKVTEAQEYRVI